MAHNSSASPTVTVLHTDDSLLDLLQYELEQAGIETHAVQLDATAPVAQLLPYLPDTTDACVVGLGRPLPYTRQLLAALGPWLRGRPVLGLSATPSLLQQVFGQALTAYAQEAPDPEQTAGIAVSLVRRWVGRAAPPPVALPGLCVRAAQACSAAQKTALLSQAIRATAQALRQAGLRASEA